MKIKMTVIAVMTAALLGEKIETSGQSAPPNMALIPAGSFQMGDVFNEGGEIDKGDKYSFTEILVHIVYVSSFYMDKYDVTKALWDEVYQWAINNGFRFESIGSGKATNHPVQTITWFDAVKWCNARSEKENRVPAYYINALQTTVYRTGDIDIQNDWVKWNTGYRLPTEAEWEKAARGGLSGKRFPWGDTISHDQANYTSSSTFSYDVSPTRGYHPTFDSGILFQPNTSPVDYFAPNGYGLYDMAGNVWQWCWDWLEAYSTDTQSDPHGPSSGEFRVYRPGGWDGLAIHCRTAYRRNTSSPYYKYSNIGFRTVLPLTTLDPIQVIETLPVQPTYGELPKKEEGKDSLVVVTHGWQPSFLPVDIEWVNTMTNTISKYLINQRLTKWQVHAYRWVEGARTVNAKKSLNKAKEEGVSLGREITGKGFSHVHLIAHSAGARLIQSASEIIKSGLSSNTVVHLTFLDAFVGFDYEERGNYGKGANWSDSYFTRDFETSGGIYPFTESPLKHAYNVDVTWLSTNKVSKRTYSSSRNEVIDECYETATSHGWPVDFYSNTITGTVTSEYKNFGFPLSKEGGGWNFATDQYGIPNSSPLPLGPPDPQCFDPIYTSTPAFVGTPMSFSKTPSVISLTGIVQINALGIDFIADILQGTRLQSMVKHVPSVVGPAWLASTVTITNAVNFISFETSFLSNTGSEGLLSVYWETNVIGSIDERVTLPGIHQYTFPLPETAEKGTRTLGFRLDAFSNIQSSVTVTNVALGFVGIREPFYLSFTGKNSNGLPVIQLTGPAGFNYTVEASTDLIDWVTVAILVNTNGTVKFFDRESASYNKRFYRVVAPY